MFKIIVLYYWVLLFDLGVNNDVILLSFCIHVCMKRKKEWLYEMEKRMSRPKEKKEKKMRNERTLERMN